MVSKDSSSFQNLLIKLCNFWGDFGCVLIPPAQTEISSPLFHPNTFFGMINDGNIDTMYFQPHVYSKELNSIKFGVQNYTFLKFQIVIKSKVLEPQKLFLDSLEYIGLDLKNNDIRFSNENYENFIFRINAFGYKILFNNIVIAKLHYIQNVGYRDFASVPLIILYDLDKILMILQKKNNLYDVSWNGLGSKNKIPYSNLMLKQESEYSEFIKNTTTNEMILQELNNFENIASMLLKENIVIPAYNNILKAKNCLDILCSKNYIMYNERLDYNKDLRDLVDLCCEQYLQKIKRTSNE